MTQGILLTIVNEWRGLVRWCKLASVGREGHLLVCSPTQRDSVPTHYHFHIKTWTSALLKILVPPSIPEKDWNNWKKIYLKEPFLYKIWNLTKKFFFNILQIQQKFWIQWSGDQENHPQNGNSEEMRYPQKLCFKQNWLKLWVFALNNIFNQIYGILFYKDKNSITSLRWIGSFISELSRHFKSYRST